MRQLIIKRHIEYSFQKESALLVIRIVSMHVAEIVVDKR